MTEERPISFIALRKSSISADDFTCTSDKAELRDRRREEMDGAYTDDDDDGKGDDDDDDDEVVEENSSFGAVPVELGFKEDFSILFCFVDEVLICVFGVCVELKFCFFCLSCFENEKDFSFIFAALADF